MAIKKIPKVFDDLVDGKRILREIKLLALLEHENVISVKVHANIVGKEGRVHMGKRKKNKTEEAFITVRGVLRPSVVLVVAVMLQVNIEVHCVGHFCLYCE